MDKVCCKNFEASIFVIPRLMVNFLPMSLARAFDHLNVDLYHIISWNDFLKYQ
jgi:hypothetical protein